MALFAYRALHCLDVLSGEPLRAAAWAERQKRPAAAPAPRSSAGPARLQDQRSGGRGRAAEAAGARGEGMGVPHAESTPQLQRA